MAKVFCWGNTCNGELGLGGIEDEHILLPRKQRLAVDRNKYGVRQLCSGRNHTLVLLATHVDHRTQVLSCGSNERHQLGRDGSWRRFDTVDGLDHHLVVRLCCGANHSLALTSAGQIFAWGCNLFGQLGIGNKVDESVAKPSLVKRLAPEMVVQIACGGNHSLALTINGSVYSWGSNTFGQLGNGLRGKSESSPIEIVCLQSVPVRQLSCGGCHSAILSNTGAIYMWGKNEFGQLGLNDVQNRSTPTVQTSLRSQRISFMDCGEEHTVALTADGGLFSWGAGMYGQLGHAKNHNEILPRRVFELMGNVVTQVSCGRCHTLATIGSKGRLYSFGLNGSGQLGIGTQVSKSVPMNVTGKWAELGIKDMCVRKTAGSLLPVVTNDQSFNTSPNISEPRSPSKLVKKSTKKDETVEDVDSHEMSIDELSDSDASDCDISDIVSSDETAIIEEPEDLINREFLLAPGFICTPDVIVSTKPDSVQIDEYFSDPDSDSQSNTQRPQLVVKEIIASKGDQSFVLVVRLSDNSCPIDFRYHHSFDEIYKLDEKRLKQLNETLADNVIAMDDIDYIENAFTSVSCWNSSFIDDKTSSSDSYLPAIDWTSAQKGFELIETAKNSRLKELIYESILKIIPKLPDIENEKELDPEVLRIYMLILLYLFRSDYKNLDVMQKLVAGYMKAVLSLHDVAIEVIKEWFSQLDCKQFGQFVHNVKNCLIDLFDKHNKLYKPKLNYTQRQEPGVPLNSQFKPIVDLCLKFLRLLWIVNQKCGKISYKDFYIQNISEMYDVEWDYIEWYALHRFGSIGRNYGPPFLCNSPYVLDPSAKTQILAVDSALQQQQAMENSVIRPVLLMSGQLSLMVEPFLTLHVDRNNILQTTINQLIYRSQLKSQLNDFKKPLKVNFEGEEGIDGGIGMKKEFFLLLMKELLDQKYGMFCEYNETHTIWFNPGDGIDNDELTNYSLVGMICGLAIYNQVIIYLPFPLVLYKQLLNEPLDLEDLECLDPILTKNLREIRDTQYSEEEFNAIYSDMNFTITLTCFGSPVEFELLKDGKHKPLNYHNRDQYVKLYWSYILNESVAQKFKYFKAGFNKVLDSEILALFHAEELMQLVSGQEVCDWQVMQESATKYKEPFSASHPTIQKFWNVFHSLSNEQKKKFLLFLTGSDRIPILGMKALNIQIQSMKVSEEYLPVAHTCFNILDLPEHYSTEDKLRLKLLQAIECSHVFALA